jgi:hypothetical protein
MAMGGVYGCDVLERPCKAYMMVLQDVDRRESAAAGMRVRMTTASRIWARGDGDCKRQKIMVPVCAVRNYPPSFGHGADFGATRYSADLVSAGVIADADVGDGAGAGVGEAAAAAAGFVIVGESLDGPD